MDDHRYYPFLDAQNHPAGSNYCLYAGYFYFVVPIFPEIGMDSGKAAILQCVLDDDSTPHGGSFVWTGPAVTSAGALNTPGSASTLGAGQSDEGSYNYSFTDIGVTLVQDVFCKLPTTDPGFISLIVTVRDACLHLA